MVSSDERGVKSVAQFREEFVKEKPKEEENTTMFEPRYYKHNTTGAIEKVSTQERANALENHTDWKRFSYTFQETSNPIVPLSFKDKLKQEIERLRVDRGEIEEEIKRLSGEAIDMLAKEKEWQDMLDRYTRFTDRYCDTLL
jgi:hypothetical protein